MKYFITVQPCGKKVQHTVWELAHKTVFCTFLTYGALPKRGNDALAAFSSFMAELLQICKLSKRRTGHLCFPVIIYKKFCFF